MEFSKVVFTLLLLGISQFSFSASEKLSEDEQRAVCVAKDLKTVKDLGDPKLSDKDASTIILFGDIQTYTPRMENQPVLDLMTAWVASRIKTLNIKALLQTGDIVEHNGVLHTRKGNQNSKQMWEWASHCFTRLDNRIPYILATGNHEYGRLWGGDKESSQFTKYFDPSRNYKNLDALIDTYTVSKIRDRLDNGFYVLDIGGKWGNVYVLALEFNPSKAVISWASKFLEKYKNETVILLTHNYLNTNGRISNKALWENLVKKSPQIKLVICGHHCSNISDFEGSVAFRQDVNDANKKVSAMMFDPQTIGGGFTGNGGDGWLRILELQPDGKTIKVNTYSPLFGFSPMTKNLAWRTAAYDMFEFVIDK